MSGWVVVGVVAIIAAAIAIGVSAVDPVGDAGDVVKFFFPLWGSLFFGLLGLVMLPVAFVRLFREVGRSFRDMSWVTPSSPAAGADGTGRQSRWSRLRLTDYPSRPSVSVNKVKWWPFLILACSGILVGGKAAVEWPSGDRLFAILLAGLAIVPLLSTAGWRAAGTFTGTATADASGAVLRANWRVNAIAFVVLLDATAVLLAWAILGQLGMVDSPGLLRESPGGFLLMFGTMGVLTAVFLIGVIRRRGIGYIRLTVDGFEFADGIFKTTGSWSEVTAISDINPQRAALPVRAVTLVNADGYTATVQRPDFYVAHAGALREWIDFYWQHPQYRQELTDDRAPARLRDAEAIADLDGVDG